MQPAHSIFVGRVAPARFGPARTGQRVTPVAEPPPRATCPIEGELHAALDAPARHGETLDFAFRRKEAELRVLFGALRPIDAMALHKRLAHPRPGDLLAERFARLVIERRTRLLAFLGDARRREAIGGRRG
jgi:hypothetical protein